MKLTKLIGENGDWAKEALNALLDSTDERILKVQAMNEEETITLIKGFCAVLGMLATRLSGEPDKPMQLLAPLRAAMEHTSEGHGGESFSQHRQILDLLTAMDESEAVFYLKLYSLESLPECAIGLSTLFDTLTSGLPQHTGVVVEVLYDQIERLI